MSSADHDVDPLPSSRPPSEIFEYHECFPDGEGADGGGSGGGSDGGGGGGGVKGWTTAEKGASEQDASAWQHSSSDSSNFKSTHTHTHLQRTERRLPSGLSQACLSGPRSECRRRRTFDLTVCSTVLYSL